MYGVNNECSVFAPYSWYTTHLVKQQDAEEILAIRENASNTLLVCKFPNVYFYYDSFGDAPASAFETFKNDRINAVKGSSPWVRINKVGLENLYNQKAFYMTYYAYNTKFLFYAFIIDHTIYTISLASSLDDVSLMQAASTLSTLRFSKLPGVSALSPGVSRLPD